MGIFINKLIDKWLEGKEKRQAQIPTKTLWISDILQNHWSISPPFMWPMGAKGATGIRIKFGT